MIRRSAWVWLASLASVPVAWCAGTGGEADGPRDPLGSPAWAEMRAGYLADGEVQFDPRVKVILPSTAENALEVPVEVDAALPGVQEIVVLADLNPIPRILAYSPGSAQPRLAFRFKVEQSTPVHAAARTADGVWHVGGQWLTAAGGGCTTPSRGTGAGLWHDHLNEVSARLWPEANGREHLKVRIMHPMDTGLAGGIPSFHIDNLQIADAGHHPIARLTTYEPVSENPVLDFDIPDTHGAVFISGADTNGNRIAGLVAPTARAAAR